MRASVNCGNNEIIVGFTPINVARIGWKFFEGRRALMSRVRTFSRGIEGQWPPLSSVDRVSTPSGTGKVKKNNLRFTVKVETSIVCRMGPLMRIRASSYVVGTRIFFQVSNYCFYSIGKVWIAWWIRRYFKHFRNRRWYIYFYYFIGNLKISSEISGLDICFLV